MPSLPIAPDDAVRTPDKMDEPDKTGSGGRWLDVPRLAQFNGLSQSWLWCGRASASMIYDYYCKAQGKSSEYIGHKTGKVGVGPNGKYADNLRWMGGSHADEIAAVNEAGKCAPAMVFEKLGWKVQTAFLEKTPGEKIDLDRPAVEKRFQPIVEALEANNPVLIYTRLSTSKNGGHIVVISGWKKHDDDLWLRINDPTNPHVDLLQSRNLQLVQKHAHSFSEYWVRASRLLESYPKKDGKRLLSYMEAKQFGLYLYVTDQAVADDKEVVHKLTRAGPAPGKDDKPKDDAGPKPAVKPAEGGASLPFPVNKSHDVTAESLALLYHQSERGMNGTFPLGEMGMFHSGAHFLLEPNTAVSAISKAEVAAARIGVGPAEHPWGDTGFVLLRHALDGGKTLYSLYLHLQREPLHPDRTKAGWLRRLLIGAMGGGEAKKPKWRIKEAQPTWTDAEKGKFSPTNVHTDKPLDPGVYEEEDRLGADHGLYVKLKGSWVRVPPDASAKISELSPWSDFDIETAAKNNPAVKALVDGKVAVLDADKKDGKRIWTVEAGEPVGSSGYYYGAPAMHWSTFSKDAIFPAGSLPEQEYGEKDEVKLAALELSEDFGTPEHVKKIVGALDPKKTSLGKIEEGIVKGGEVQLFYRKAVDCWRSRYQAVKGLTELALDVDKFVAQESNKSHPEAERTGFKKNAQTFLFWKDLSAVEDFPTDGKAVFVHPVSALRLMAHVKMARDVSEGTAEIQAEDRLHPHDDVTVLLRDAKGPLAEVKVTVKAGGAVIHEGTTDAGGELLLPIEAVQDQELEISVDASVVGDKGQLMAVVNDTGGPPTVMPGDAPGNQTFNGTDTVPAPRMGLNMRVKKGQKPGFFPGWDEKTFKPTGKAAALKEGDPLVVERIVFRLETGKSEVVQAFSGDKLGYLWSIADGVEAVEVEPAAHQQAQGKEPVVIAGWSAKTAHLNDHPVLAGRVQNIDDGKELEVTFCAILATGAPEHDEELHLEKVKVAVGGFSLPFDPHVLTTESNLLDQPRPVYARVKVGDKVISLRDQPITVYDETKVQEHAPKPPKPEAKAGATTVYGFVEIARKSEKLGEIKDRFTTKDGKEPQIRRLSQLSGPAAARFAGDGNDEVYIGGTVGEMHLATEDQANLTADEAMRRQIARGKQLYPDIPDWIFAKPEQAYYKDNGMTVGICAQDCPKEVHKKGLQTGCTETIRQNNLLSCKNAKQPMCKTAVTPGSLPVVATKCYSALGICHSVGHDKSKCFLQTVVRGPDNEDRERWYVSIPMKMKDGIWPYHGGHNHGNNLRVVLVNPRNGKAVVCSMEDYGPSGKTNEGHPAIPEASVAKNEFLDGKWGHICGMSYETRWKLDLHGVHGEPIVLLAFVPSNTPLGPLAEGAVIKLRKTATYAQILGKEKVPEKAS